jgi:hypothetical protein
MHDKFVADFTRLTKQFHELAHRIKNKETALVSEIQALETQREWHPRSLTDLFLEDEMRDVMARRRETLTQYNASTWQEVDAAIIKETNKGGLR